MRVPYLLFPVIFCLLSFNPLVAQNGARSTAEILAEAMAKTRNPVAGDATGKDAVVSGRTEGAVVTSAVGKAAVAQVRAEAAAEIRAIGQARTARVRAKASALGLETRIKKPGGGLIEIYDFEGDEPIYLETKNDNAAISTGAAPLHDLPYELDGSGLTVGLWDVGSARTSHQEFAGGRVVSMDGASSNFHTTNMAGTIAAAGLDPRARGMAFNTRIDSYDWQDDNAEMIERAAYGPDQFDTRIYISNHSYGVLAGWSGNRWLGDGSDQNGADHNFGQYSKFAQAQDAIIYNSPYFLSVWSSGNDGRDNPRPGNSVTGIGDSAVTYDPAIHPLGDGVYRNGFDTIVAQAIGKNVLTIGAVEDAVTAGVRDPAKAILGGFSSAGPTDDGRIKPDLVGNGVDVYTTTDLSDTSYGSSTGTSMAAPTVTGSAALVIDQYKRLFNSAMRASTLKGLLIHSATDLGNPGPDYKYGWGLTDVKKAVDLVIDHHANPEQTRIHEDVLTTEVGSQVHTFDWSNSTAIRATICWSDPPGPDTSEHDSRTPRLVNDLNLKLVAPDGSEYFPFVMPFVGAWSTASMSENASTGVNDRDNVEQILLANPGQNGQWQLVVDHVGALTDGAQAYSLLLSQELVDSSVLALRSVAPASRSRDTTEPVEIYGTGFVADSAVKLTRSGEPDILATSVEVTSLGLLRCHFDLSGAALGDWDLVVTNPDAQSATLIDVFEVTLSLNTALDTSGFDWSTSSDRPWFTQVSEAHDGVDAAQSGGVAENRSSTLSTTLTESGELTFYWKVSSESGSDFLRIFRNGVELTGDLAAISGEVDWVQKTVPIPNGTTTVEWQYTRDTSGTTAGADAAWLDEVVFTPIPLPEIVVEQSVGTALLSGASTVDFGAHLVGESSPATTITIRNAGTTDLTGLALVKNGSHSADFALGSLGATTLGIGESTTFTVTFSPDAEGARSAVLQILSNDPIQGIFEIVLAGAGLTPRELVVSPTVNVPYGPPGGPFTPDSVQYTLSNPGGTPIDWSATPNANWFDISPVSGTLDALGETIVTITFNANAGNFGLGEHQATISFNHLGSDEPATARIVSLLVVDLATALDAGGIVWSTGGDANWFAQNDVTHDGVDAAQSGSIIRNRSSSLSATLEGPGTLTFKWKVSSDAFGDYLAFYLDGTLQTGDLRRIAGNKDWTLKTVAIPAGSHTVEWRYSKDTYVDGGADAAWVDEVRFTVPAPEIVVEQPLLTALVNGVATVDFTQYEAGDSPPVASFTVRNLGDSDLTDLALSKSGTDAADFTLGALGSTTLAPGESTSFTVTFYSGLSGTRSALLQIVSNDEDENPFDIALSGRNLSVSPYQDWASENNLVGSDSETLADPDFDTLANIQEFAFGTDPLISNAGRLAFVIDGELTTAGSPLLMNLAQPGQSNDFRIVFPRRKDHAAIGLHYSVLFSADLVRWTTSSASPTVLTDPGSSHNYEVVSLAFPSLVPVANDGEPKPARFTRITVSTD